VNANPKIHSLQALRAIAASLVVVDHTLLELSGNKPGAALTNIAWTFGSIGVYVFFVVSGFIMVHVSWSQFGGAHASLTFFRRRTIRIVPLYWLGTLAAFGFHKISATHGAQDGWRELAYSFVFVPYQNDDGAWSPILPQGWTLNYEMVFYVIFALGLCAPRRVGLPIVGAALLALVSGGARSPPAAVAFLASPIILWFLLGIALAVVWRRWKLCEPTWISRPARFLEPVGDASYSLYLVHGFVLTMVLRIWVGVVGTPSMALLPLSLAAAVVAGRVTYIAIERPLLGLLSGKTNTKATIINAVKSAPFST
jgi:exopolysaccharide production protein ExoZ